MKFIPNAVTLKLGRQILTVQKHSPTLLFATGVVGVVATVVLASKATLKLDETLTAIEKDKAIAKEVLGDGTDKNYTERDYRKDLVLIQVKGLTRITKLYAPAFVVGVVAVGCLTGSHIILTQRNVALTAAYAGLEKAFKEYRERVVSEVGEDREREIRFSAEDKQTLGLNGKTTTKKVPGEHSQSVYARFFDQTSKNWSKTPEYNLFFLRCQQTYLNDLLKARGHVFLNEVYDVLDIERSKAGAVVGWVIGPDGDNYIDFGMYDGNNERARDFVNGREGAIMLDFNVDGVIYDKI